MATLLLQTTQPIKMYLTTKMLPPFGEEGHSPNENAGFPVITNITCNRSIENAGFPYTTKLHAEEGDHMLLKCDTMLMKHYFFLMIYTVS